MAVYYRFKSAKDYHSIAMDGPFISVRTLKEKIFESKYYSGMGRANDFDHLVVINAHTNEEYIDEASLIPRNSSVLIRRIPRRLCLPIVVKHKPKVEIEIEETEVEKSTALRFPADSEWDDFGDDIYANAIPEVLPLQPSDPIPYATPTNKAEDRKNKAFIDTPALDTPTLDWQRQGSDGFGGDRGFDRGVDGRIGRRDFGRAGFEWNNPPPGYVCHRCKVPGHFIQHCPTNGDPNYDIKRVKPSTGIPKSMLMANLDGSYALPSGVVAVLKPDEASFERGIEGLSSTRLSCDFPPELHCPLCKEVMKDAVLASKCCFKSFCYECIRDYFSKSACICGATNILADDLLPNKTLRDTINHIMESSGNSSTGSIFQVQDMELARVAQPKVLSPTLYAASRGEKNILSLNEETTKVKEVQEENVITSGPQTSEKVRPTRVVDESEASHESMSVKEQASQGSSLIIVDEEVRQKMAASEAVNKKKKKKVRMPTNDFQWKTSQDLATENNMMPMGGPTPYNPYWNGMQPGFDAYMSPYAAPMPYMGGYGLRPMGMPFGPVMPQDPFRMQNYMFPGAPPQRDHADFGMGMNIAAPLEMNREEFEARKADSMRRKHENERRVEREWEPPKDQHREFSREVSSSGDVYSMKQKYVQKFAPRTSTGEHNQNHGRPKSSLVVSRNVGPPCPLPRKRKSEHHDHDIDNHYGRGHGHHRQHSEYPAASEVSTKSIVTAASYCKQQMSVCTRISFPNEEMKKKRKLPSSKEAPPSDSGASSTHLKPSPTPPSDWNQEESRHPRGSTRERERKQERSSYIYNKHR